VVVELVVFPVDAQSEQPLQVQRYVFVMSSHE
jgi:hypothetical protein